MLRANLQEGKGGKLSYWKMEYLEAPGRGYVPCQKRSTILKLVEERISTLDFK